MLKIGITGNIASGKSEVEKIIEDEGFFVADLDKITHDLYSKTSIKTKLLKEFKTDKRNEISKIVFLQNKKLKKLEDIIHPELKNYVLELFETKKEKIIFVSGALLYETNFDKLFDKIIFVDADYDLRLQRLIKRNLLNEEEAKKRLNCQNIKYKNQADYIIENNFTREELKQKVTNLLKKIAI